MRRIHRDRCEQGIQFPIAILIHEAQRFPIQLMQAQHANAVPGQPRREDYEYERQGVVNLFLFCEPLTGWREIQVSERRTRTDWAAAMRELSDRHYPAAERITVVLDN